MIEKSVRNACRHNHNEPSNLLRIGNLALDATVRPFADNLVRVTLGAGNRVGYLRDVCRSVAKSGANIVECSMDMEVQDWGGRMLLEATPEQGEQVKAALEKYTAPQDPPPAFVPGGRLFVYFCGRNRRGLLFKITKKLASPKWNLNILRLRCYLLDGFAVFSLEVEWEEKVRPSPTELAKDLRKYGWVRSREVKLEDDQLLLWLMDLPLDSLP